MTGQSAEEGFIAALRAIARDPGARGLTDDAAELSVSASTLVITHDMMVEGVHWLPRQDPADVAWKLVAANLSDLAAKGAQPLALVMGYMLGDAAWNARFVEGLDEAVVRFGVALLGGDTVSTPQGSARSIGITAIGQPQVVPSPSRADAKPGQALWITGTVGGALAGFEALRAGSTDEALTAPFRRPEPHVAAGEALAKHVGAMMDVSDGLLLDATRMAQASGTTIAIDSSAVPVVPALADRRDEAMRWGDDYNLLFTLSEGSTPPVAATRIGTVMAGSDRPLLIDGTPPDSPDKLGYLHRQP
ncbi:thiamine-phosphate kinase [Croceicoccus naphthovorans]|uniref:Thiamine-monophosphate kinase n=1 Tax=Croceicoccus naphthovorans TaxID=1348774 RepID=A0A0G3XEZ9_9SPHN|nr:thiamine-phosphate kinase [Croceicoccus naphthovorans]AKM09216.1 thiamine-monophosphate kinase [Croceicoccus naphthovorans]MBB3990400.1 thiamine-monophosphate kinase [Croceicoccus naphthovorans]